ncbi:MAG: putative Ras-related protein Rab7 [Terrestrivirus sp.]|uniref:Putative Ras-related protein Rab7 n=1 Tax=Terrestrivirus sp. TaxID=2487775 RepID=A0A3G4ZM08_9VIRU|nr:MAG: putative Ras-related protein Rab7 [Terrestrivirus sp.]
MPRKHLFKIIILGDSYVGKTSLLERYTKNKFNTSYKATIGTDFLSKEVIIENQLITLQIWDTAGQERFFSLGNAFYRGADGVVFAYDLTNRASFDNLQVWHDEFLVTSGSKKKIPFIIVGNKCDINNIDDIKVQPSVVTSWITKNDIEDHVIVSAKTNENVDQMFNKLIQKMLQNGYNIHDYMDFPELPLKIDNNPPTSKCSC